MPEVVYMQRFMGIEGVIVDLVSEITEAVSDFIKNEEEIKEEIVFAEDGKLLVKNKSPILKWGNLILTQAYYRTHTPLTV